MKTRIHISVPVSNLEASKQFYAALFGVAPSKVKTDYANWRLDQPALHLALVQAPKVAGGHNPVRHFGVELFSDSDLQSWRKRAAEAGLALRDEEQVVCCYAKADKFWAQDPDGNEWEFWVRLEEAEAMKGESRATGSECCAPAATAKAQSACCTPAQKAEAQAAGQGCC